MSETTTRPEPHAWVRPAASSGAAAGWCAREDCGWGQDAYIHASEEGRRLFDAGLRPAAEIRTVAHSALQHQLWIAAAEPEHAFREDSPRTETYCRVCGYTRNAVAHLADSERRLAHNAIYAAEELIRADHPILSPEWRFWGGIADHLNSWASRGKSGSVHGAREISDFNKALVIAYGYEETRSTS